MIFFKKSESSPEREISRELMKIEEKIQSARLPENVLAVAESELEKLKNTDASLAEYTIGLNYLEFLLSLPWFETTEDSFDLQKAERILDSHHYGLRHVKERVLEYLATRTLCYLQAFRILVVDDEQIARSNLEYVLRKDGYEVDSAENGLEAYEKIKTEDYDLVLADLKMEKMDGIQLLEAIREISPSTDTIIITGYATVSTAVAALQKGAINYLSKPIKLDELREMVASIRENRRHLRLIRGPILCFTGPPGTGKTSVGRSIAEAIGRRFVRISLAGLRDEAELRGHRRTYVGALPGRIIREIKRVGVKNPVFVLDEIDKMGQEFYGDAISILLEILDPEQNNQFVDSYLDVPFDLSSVMFVATANIIENLPKPLVDRFEVIEFPGYAEKEKMVIARNYLIPKQLQNHGLRKSDVLFEDEAIKNIIRGYTREAGVRQLERQVANVCRKLARITLANGKSDNRKIVDTYKISELLGPPKFGRDILLHKPEVGITTGLVVSASGGEAISIEAAKMNGTGRLILTGSFGEVLKESAQTALSYVRSRANKLGIDPDFFRDMDIHIHIPLSAIEKDGASAGLAIVGALISLLTSKPAKRDVALTGEITLSGRVLHVGGLREKILAAQRYGISQVVIPAGNVVDVEALDEDVLSDIQIVSVYRVGEIMDILF